MAAFERIEDIEIGLMVRLGKGVNMYRVLKVWADGSVTLRVEGRSVNPTTTVAWTRLAPW